MYWIWQKGTFDDTSAEKRKPYYYAVTTVIAGGRERTAVASTGPLTPGDNDGLDDSWEERYFSGLGALPGGDPDGDDLSNLREMEEFTDPTKADTDGDFAPDGMELERGMNPLVQDVSPLRLTAMADGISIFHVSDVNEDGTIGPQELAYILWKISMP